MSILEAMMNDETKSFEARETIKVQLNQIEINPLNNAPIDDIEELALYIKQDGLKEKPRVYKVRNNRYRLLSGERRYRACKLNGIEAIEVILVSKPVDEAEELLEIDASNETRPQSAIFLNSRIQLLSKAYDLKKAQGHIETGTLKRDWISLRMFKKLSARQIQNYLSGNVKALETAVVQSEPVEKEFDIEKDGMKKVKQLKKIYEWYSNNKDYLSNQVIFEMFGIIRDFEDFGQ